MWYGYCGLKGTRVQVLNQKVVYSYTLTRGAADTSTKYEIRFLLEKLRRHKSRCFRGFSTLIGSNGHKIKQMLRDVQVFFNVQAYAMITNAMITASLLRNSITMVRNA